MHKSCFKYVFWNAKISLLHFFPQLNGSAGVCVFRTYEDFEWLQQSLFSQENVPGLQGIIVSEFSKRYRVHPCQINQILKTSLAKMID